MSANVKTADLAITIVVTLLKAAGLGPEADRILDAIEGAKSCIGLIDDIKNEIVSDPNKDLIRSLFKTMEEEVRSIKDDLKEQGLGKDEIESTADALIETTRLTVKQLAQDDDALLDAARLPDSFFKVLVHRAEPLPDWCDDTIGKLYEQLLKRVSAEFIERAKDFDRFDKVALASLLRDNLSAKKQRNRIERGVQENRAINLETNRVVKEDRATGLETNQIVKELVQRHPYSIPSRLIFGSRPDVVAEDRFIERREQKQLNSLIADPTRGRTVLVGMRGCGKTQLAASLAKQCEDANWNLVAWLNAVSRESIQSDLVELAKQLGIGTSDLPTQNEVIRRCLNHLQSVGPADRLIVFDNVEDINHLTGLIPSGDGVRVVATTTNKVGWEDQGWNSIKVEVFDRNTSIEYLLTVTKSDDHDAADALAERLGDLPLAIAQAAATARHKDLSLARYLKRLKSRGAELAIRPIHGDEYTVDAVKALLMAVKDTIKGLEGNTKETAQRQLGALALLAESGVPTRWLDPTVTQLDDDESPDTQRDTDEDAHDALTELIHRSIVQQSADGTMIMLHRLQAQVLRESWNEKETAEAYESTTILLGTVDIDSFPHNNIDSIDLIAQFAAMSTQHHSQQLFCDDRVRSCLLQALLFADTFELPVEPHGLANVVVILENILGSDHVDIVTARNCLAGAYRSAGYFPESSNLYEWVLTDRIRILGESHRSTLATRSDLASTHALAGLLPEAISQYKQVLDEQTRILGTEDVNTLTTQYNLASAYFISQQYNLAIPLYEQVLSKQTSSLGPNHPHTLVTQSSLAFAYFSTGNLSEAISLYKQVLPNQIERLGPSHRYTLTTRENIATVYRLEGDLNKAIDQYETILKDCTDALGTKHPLTVDVHKKLEAARRELAEQEDSSHIEERGTQGRGTPTPAGH